MKRNLLIRIPREVLSVRCWMALVTCVAVLLTQATASQAAERPNIVLIMWEGSAAIRQGRWKAVWDKLVERWELYDLEKDRTETTDLAGDEPALVAQLAADYDHWAIRTGNHRVQPLVTADKADRETIPGS